MRQALTRPAVHILGCDVASCVELWHYRQVLVQCVAKGTAQWLGEIAQTRMGISPKLEAGVVLALHTKGSRLAHTTGQMALASVPVPLRLPDCALHFITVSMVLPRAQCVAGPAQQAPNLDEVEVNDTS